MRCFQGHRASNELSNNLNQANLMPKWYLKQQLEFLLHRQFNVINYIDIPKVKRSKLCKSLFHLFGLLLLKYCLYGIWISSLSYIFIIYSIKMFITLFFSNKFCEISSSFFKVLHWFFFFVGGGYENFGCSVIFSVFVFLFWLFTLSSLFTDDMVIRE